MIGVKRARGRPKREDAQRLAEHLLDVATRTFIAQGYGGATMDGIAAAAGIGKHTLYSRYSDKEALLLAVMERLGKRHVLEPFAQDGEVPLAEGLRNRARAILHNVLIPEHLALYALRMREGQHFPEVARITDRGARLQFVDDLEAYFKAQIARGTIPSRDIATMLRMFLGMIVMPVTMALVFRSDMPGRGDIDRHVADVVDIFLHGVTSAPAAGD